MSIKKYTNIESINDKSSNEGQFLQSDDLFIVSKSEVETTEFGNSKYDVMEVSVYDSNNTLLPQKSGNNVAYIKTNDIKNYMYQITNKSGQKELAINIEKLLNELGFTNGVLKVNINFIRYKVGSENELERVWIEEISPSREEIRIIPLKTKFANINSKTNQQLINLQGQNKDFKYYKDSILDSLNSFQNTFLSKIDSTLETKYGKDFFSVIKKDFGLSNFVNVRTKIFTDFKTSVEYYLTNKYYDVIDSRFGKKSDIRFESDDIYDFNLILIEIENILNNCVNSNLQFLKRRELDLKVLPKEFSITELQKQIKNNLDSFNTYSEIKRNVYSPDGTAITFNDTNTGFTEPVYPTKGTLIKTICKGYDKYQFIADGNGGTTEEFIESNSKDCGYIIDPPPPPDNNNGGGTSGGTSGGGNGGGGTRTGGGRNEVVADDYRMDNQK
jgi:uncharacterized membrane protein YgcG